MKVGEIEDAPSVGSIKPKNALRTVCASDIDPQPIRWLWPQRFALGKLNLIAGDPGLGKSILTLDMAARVTRGETWPVDGTSAPLGSVLIVSAEDDPADTIIPRLMAAGADLALVRIAEQVIDYGTEIPIERELSLDRDLELLAAQIADDCRLVIVDPISAYLGRTDSHNNADLRTLLTPLGKLAHRSGVAVVAVTHLNKGAGGSASYRICGSIAFTAAPRAVYAVTKDQDDPDRRLLVPVKNNLGDDKTGFAYRIASKPNGAPYLEWEPDLIDVSADEALNPDIDGRQGAREEAKEFLEDYLQAGPQKAQDVLKGARQIGVNESTLRRAKAELRIHSGKAEFAGGWFWSLNPPESDQHSQKTLPESVTAFDAFAGFDHLREVISEAVSGLTIGPSDALKLFSDDDRNQIERGDMNAKTVRHFVETTLAESPRR